jgi:hypothetical protein
MRIVWIFSEKTIFLKINRKCAYHRDIKRIIKEVKPVKDYAEYISQIEQTAQNFTNVSDALAAYQICHDFEMKLEQEIDLLNKRKPFAKNPSAIDARLTHLGALRKKAANAADLCFFAVAHTVSFQGTEAQYAITVLKLFSKKTTFEISKALSIGVSTCYRYWSALLSKSLLGKEEFPP